MTAIHFDNIPPVLTQYRQWVVWRYETRQGQEKPTKVPYNARNGRKARTDSPDTWSTYEEARQALARSKRFDGLGFVITADDPFAGVDLDDCIDAETGELRAQAAEIVARLDSYTEVTVSGKGLRVWVQAKLPPGKRRVGPIEMYDAVRFFTLTGQVMGERREIEARQEELAALHGEIFREKSKNERAGRPRSGEAVSLSDQDLLQRAQEARNGPKFRQLYYGGHSGPDQSGSDMALCNLLAFWTGGDGAAMDRLFRGSALMREKWDERHAGDGRTYGQMTIERALADCREGYRGPGREDDGYRTVKQAAEELGISPQAVRKRMSKGDIPTKRTPKGLLLVNLGALQKCPATGETDNQTTETTENRQPDNQKQTTRQPKIDNQTTKNRQPDNRDNQNSDNQTTKTDNQTTDMETTGCLEDDIDIYDRMIPPADAAEPGSDEKPIIITNNYVTWIESDKGSKPIYFAHRLPDIYRQVIDVTGGWPRRVGTMLFFDREGEIQFMERHPDYFAWLADYGAISWRAGLSQDNQSFSTKEEAFSYAASHSQLYEDIAAFPHEPPLPGHYYSWRPRAEYQPTGQYFNLLLSFFSNVETPADALLIRAMFMTPAWGGALKERPAFAITAPDRGCGKSTLADAVGSLYGGTIDINLSKRAEEEILQRLLTPAARLQRIVRIDNIKGEVNSPLLDALITTTHVSGKQMYKGEARRPNTLVYLLTGNALRLSRDMAERCFIIHLAQPEYSPDWQSIVNQFITDYQHYILMDIIAELHKPTPKYNVSDRWAAFAAEVLSRCSDDAAAVRGAISQNNQRRGGTDTDVEEAEILLETIKELQGEYTSNNWMFVTRRAVVNACNDALNKHLPTGAILNILREHTNAGRMHNQLKVDYKAHGGRRGVLYLREGDDGLSSGADGA